jgi:hypothetical protein
MILRFAWLGKVGWTKRSRVARHVARTRLNNCCLGRAFEPFRNSAGLNRPKLILETKRA